MIGLNNARFHKLAKLLHLHPLNLHLIAKALLKFLDRFAGCALALLKLILGLHGISLKLKKPIHLILIVRI